MTTIAATQENPIPPSDKMLSRWAKVYLEKYRDRPVAAERWLERTIPNEGWHKHVRNRVVELVREEQRNDRGPKQPA